MNKSGIFIQCLISKMTGADDQNGLASSNLNRGKSKQTWLELLDWLETFSRSVNCTFSATSWALTLSFSVMSTSILSISVRSSATMWLVLVLRKLSSSNRVWWRCTEAVLSVCRFEIWSRKSVLRRSASVSSLLRISIWFRSSIMHSYNKMVVLSYIVDNFRNLG